MVALSMSLSRVGHLLAIVSFVWAQGPALAQESFSKRLIDAAIERTQQRVHYDGSYRSIPYPMGDVPMTIGVCTDLIIRSYRALGIDLQRLVHEDMSQHFSEYPKIWGLRRPDTNIDHRRVPNLRVFFERRGESLSISRDPNQYRGGDLVMWRLPGNLPHIGIVTDRMAVGTNRPMVVHNIGRGPKLEDSLFVFPITGHFRYPPMRE